MPRLPMPVWLIMIGTLLFGLSYFMTWPFLTIILKRNFDMNAAEIGSVLSLAAIVGAGASLISGTLSDRIGRKAIIILSNLLIAIALALMAYADSATGIIFGAVVVIATRHIVDPPTRALIADLTKDTKARQLAFHLNYFMINIGASTGPFVALFLGLTARQSTFWVSAGIILFYTLGLVIALWRVANSHEHREQASFKGAFIVLLSDRVMLWLLVGSILLAYTYAQQDSSVVQYLSDTLSFERAAFIFSFVVAGNSATVIVAQFPLLWLTKSWSYDLRIRFGVLCFFAGFLIYAFIPVNLLIGWVIGTVILSIGEALLFPTLNLKVDQIAPAHLKGAYFGAYNLYALGYGLGPLAAGLMLSAKTGALLWFVAALICLFALATYARSGYLYRIRSK